nr:glycosyltransferase family 2 protein [Bacteroidota bacterium]
MDQHKTVHIIIVNYLTWQHTTECLKSIICSSYQNFKIRIVSMADCDGSDKKILNFLDQHRQLNAEFISIPENKGFAGANNLVLNKIINDNLHGYVWLLNNDITLTEDTLRTLVDAYEKLEQDNKSPGILGPKILEADVSNTIQAVGGAFNPRQGHIKFIGKGEKDLGQYDGKAHKVDYLLGAAMFLSTDVLHKIGLMDERYFLYCEDIDWCITAQNFGFNNYVCPSSVVVHEQGASTGVKYSKHKQQLNTLKFLHSSYLKLYRKHYANQIYIARFLLFKLLSGKILDRNMREALLIIKVLFRDFRANLNRKHKIPTG